MIPSHSNTLWSIILAGGEGERTRPFIQECLGYSKPKQYCTFVGSRSMLHQLYRYMPHMNFSSDVLQKVPERLGVIELEEVLWSDWGRPERIRVTLEVLGKKSAFPCEILTNTNSRLN